jgi:hypothetical protein
MADAAEDDDQEEGEATLEQSEAAPEQPEVAAEAQQPAAPEVTAPSKRHAVKHSEAQRTEWKPHISPRALQASRLCSGARAGMLDKCPASCAAALPCCVFDCTAAHEP